MKAATIFVCAALAGALVSLECRAETTPHSTTAAPAAAAPEDPAIRRGVLANGLRYAVMHADQPKGGISIRLAIDVGSFEETDQERGIAHFIEHMAFRSTKDFPDNSVDGFFASRGVKFGRDLNAETALFSTRYQLDFPTLNDEAVSLGLKWLRNVADGVVFESGPLDKERGVVLAEKEARESPDAAATTALAQFESPGSRSTAREPIGVESVLRTSTAETLRGFYQRWYRPDNAVVVLAGDLPLDALEARVKSTFGAWQSIGPPPTKTMRAPPDASRGLDTFAFARPVLLDSIRACRLGASDPDTSADLANVRRHALSLIWQEIMDKRLGTLRADPTNDLVGARIESEDNGGDLRSTCLIVFPSQGGWASALRSAQQEFRRFRDSGPTELEVETALDSIRSHLRADITEAPNRLSSQLADSIVDAELEGAVVAEPRQYLRSFDLAMEDLSVADVRAAFARDWAGAGPLVSAISAAPPSADALKSAWISVEQGAALASITDQKALVWDYDFGKPGDVVSRQAVDMGGFVRFHFRNGVTFNFKQTNFSKDSLQLAVRFGAGREEIPSKDYYAAILGGTLFALGGVGKYSFEDLQRLFQSNPGDIKIVIGDQKFQIDGEVARPNLEDKLNILAAFMSDPGFRPSVDAVLRTAIGASYRLSETSLQLKAGLALAQAVMPDSSLALPPRATFDGLDEARVADLLKPSITRDPFEITLVGDIDEPTAVRLVGATLGALPARSTSVPRRDDTVFLRFPSAAGQSLRVTHEGPADKALAEAVWPLYVATRTRRREEYAIDLLAAIFNNELRRRVRVELGKSYAPVAAAHLPDDADQGELVASVEAHPEDIELMLAQIHAVAGSLKAGAITAEQLDAARTPLIAEGRQAMNTNRRWATGLAGSSDDDQNLRDILSVSDIVGSISLDEIKKAAVDWLSNDPWTVIVEPQARKDAARP